MLSSSRTLATSTINRYLCKLPATTLPHYPSLITTTALNRLQTISSQIRPLTMPSSIPKTMRAVDIKNGKGPVSAMFVRLTPLPSPSFLLTPVDQFRDPSSYSNSNPSPRKNPLLRPQPHGPPATRRPIPAPPSSPLNHGRRVLWHHRLLRQL